MIQNNNISNGMRIGIDARLWDQGGVGRYTRNLVHNLLKIDEKNTYVLFVRKQDYENIKYQISLHFGGQANIKYNDKSKIVPVNISWHSISEQLLFPRIINKEKIDLMHFPYFSVPVLYKKPFIVTIHDLIFHHFASGQASTLPLWALGFKVLAYRFVIKNAVRRSKKIIAVSNFTKNDIVNTLKADKNKIEVIYEAADDVSARGGSSFGRKLESDKLDFDNYFLYVGNVYPHKNVGLLLESFKVLSKDNPNLKLVFVGKEDLLYKKLKKHVKKLREDGKIIFLDNVTDEKLSALYKNAICLVRTSLMEGFSLPPLEAMENRCLVLASDIPVHREVFGEEIIYFDHFTRDDILAKMRYVMSLSSEEKEKLVKKGLERAKKYSWNKTAEQTLRVYNRYESRTRL